MIVNLHTHTYRCMHATGTEEEYILRAIENGIKVMGFSEHAPFVFPGGYQSNYRIPVEETKEYFDTLKTLREKYKNEIEIYIGFEMEYYPKYFDEMYSSVKEMGAEYLILGQHFVGNEYPDGTYVGRFPKPMEILTEYVDCVIEGIKTGVFTYICHPDVVYASSDLALYKSEMTRLCKAAKEYDIPLEINFYGIRDKRFYPFKPFWKIAGEVGCRVVYGFDAHDVPSAYDGESIAEADKLVSTFGLILDEKPKIIRL